VTTSYPHPCRCRRQHRFDFIKHYGPGPQVEVQRWVFVTYINTYIHTHTSIDASHTRYARRSRYAACTRVTRRAEFWLYLQKDGGWLPQQEYSPADHHPLWGIIDSEPLKVHRRESRLDALPPVLPSCCTEYSYGGYSVRSMSKGVASAVILFLPRVPAWKALLSRKRRDRDIVSVILRSFLRPDTAGCRPIV